MTCLDSGVVASDRSTAGCRATHTLTGRRVLGEGVSGHVCAARARSHPRIVDTRSGQVEDSSTPCAHAVAAFRTRLLDGFAPSRRESRARTHTHHNNVRWVDRLYCACRSGGTWTRRHDRHTRPCGLVAVRALATYVVRRPGERRGRHNAH